MGHKEYTPQNIRNPYKTQGKAGKSRSTHLKTCEILIKKGKTRKPGHETVEITLKPKE